MSLERDFGTSLDVGNPPPRVAVADWLRAARETARAILASWVEQDPPTIRLDIRSSSLEAYAGAPDGAEFLGRADLENADEMALLAGAVRSRARALDGDATLCFSKELVFHLPLDLPKAKPAILKKAALCELERLNPVPATALYVETRCEALPQNSKVRVELRAIRRSVVDDAVARCREWGLAVGAIQFEGDARKGDWLVLPIDRRALLRRLAYAHGTAILAGISLVLFAGLLLSLYGRLSEQDDRMMAAVDSANLRAAAVYHLEREISEMRTQYAFAAAEKRAPLVIAVYAETSKLLPLNSWLTRFAMDGGRVHIQGFSKSPSDVVAAIDRSPFFANAQFAAPLVGAQDGAERFDLTFDVKRKFSP